MKYERHTTGPEFDSIWYYDTDITKNGPVSIVHKWHHTFSQMQAELKQTKQEKKEQRRVNKFFKDKDETKQTVSKSNQQQNKHVSGRGRKRKV